MTLRFRSLTAVTLAVMLVAMILATAPPGFAALSEADLAATRGMSPGYPPKTNKGTNTPLYNSCATVNRPPQDNPGITVVCTGVPDAPATSCYTCNNTSTQQAVDSSGAPSQASGYVAAQQNQACGGTLNAGTCLNGICSGATPSPNNNCTNPVPSYLQQTGATSA